MTSLYIQRRIQHQTGMTLLEVLIALVIFTIVAAAGYSGLHQGIAVQRQLQQQQNFWRNLDAVVMILEQDLEMVINIAPRVPLWDAVALKGYENGAEESFGELFRFTRNGHRSYVLPSVGPMQRTAYRLRDGVLYRVTWPGVDLPEYEQGMESELIDGIESARLRYLQEDRRWVDRWPLRFTPDDMLTLPRAIELTITLSDNLTIKRVFNVGPPG